VCSTVSGQAKLPSRVGRTRLQVRRIEAAQI
jgi:hypothetical protein